MESQGIRVIPKIRPRNHRNHGEMRIRGHNKSVEQIRENIYTGKCKAVLRGGKKNDEKMEAEKCCHRGGQGHEARKIYTENSEIRAGTSQRVTV